VSGCKDHSVKIGTYPKVSFVEEDVGHQATIIMDSLAEIIFNYKLKIRMT